MEIITIHEVHAGIGQTDAQLIDVREREEVIAGMVPGSRHIPLGDLESRLAELDPARDVWMICRSGNRSGHATELLTRSGFRAFNMVGGMIAWEQAGFVTERP